MKRSLPTRSSLVFLVASLVAGCGGGADLGSCPTDADPAVGQAIVTQRCNGCHHFSESMGITEAEDVYGEIEGGSMPPSSPLSSDEAEQVRVYLACTAE